MKIEALDNLLKDFNTIPKIQFEPTFLEICSYPRRRFEEISSRILSFYFNPINEHKLYDLFIKSLFEMIGREDIFFKQEQIKVVVEDNAEGKRIDLVVFSPDFIVGIENKITATLYNPLQAYAKRIGEYKIQNTIKIVLSLNKITKKEEIDLIEMNGFISITYSDFFETIKRNIGRYISISNTKYLIQLYDFIQTLENMNSRSKIDSRLSEFFYENSTQIKELINAYENFKEDIINVQKEKIAELKEKISIITSKNWWAWEGWALGFNSYNAEKPRIGIEAYFKEPKNNPLGEFNIYITAWKIQDWLPYEGLLIDKYPSKDKVESEKKVFMLVDSLTNPSDEEILEKLQKHDDFLVQITS